WLITLCVLTVSAACSSAPVSEPPQAEPSAETSEQPAAEEAPAEEPAAETVAAADETPCAGGVIKDDGSVETGYGYVPSAKMGQYVQRFHSDEFPSAEMDKVCVCLLRSRNDSDIDFEIVFYGDAGGRPARQPYAAVTSTATEVPKGVPDAGRFYEVDVSGVTLPAGSSYIGVRWDPSASTFFFVCTDQGEATDWVDVYSMEDRAPVWTNVKDSRDPIFKPHRSILVRAVAAEPKPE
ncbi:MAG: hypothetical protein AAF560_18375, partial [Acidobacteriota bacterium]